MKLRYIFWNLFGLGFPLIVAAIVVPRLLEVIDTERFGLLALAWGLIGYAGVLDLGIGRAVTQKISTLQGEGKECQVPDILATAVRLTSITGVIGMALIMLSALLGAYTLIKTETVTSSEMQFSMFLLAIALPIQAVSATYRGVNEAYLNFRSINTLRVFLGVANFGAPFLVSLYTIQLHWLVSTIVLSRLIALWFYRYFSYNCLRRNNVIVRGLYSKEASRSLFSFGGWFTISSVLSPLLVQADRFIIGAIISASAVTVYVLPYEVTTKALIIVGSVTSVIFPVISQQLKIDRNKAVVLFNCWLFRVVILMGGIMSMLFYLLPDLLRLWLNGSVDPDSIVVGRVLCVGVFCNSIGGMYFALLHAQGKTKLTAIIHIIEVPIFIVMLFFLINYFGVLGAAVAWSGRMFMDFLALFFVSRFGFSNNQLVAVRS